MDSLLLLGLFEKTRGVLGYAFELPLQLTLGIAQVNISLEKKGKRGKDARYGVVILVYRYTLYTEVQMLLTISKQAAK